MANWKARLTGRPWLISLAIGLVGAGLAGIVSAHNGDPTAIHACVSQSPTNRGAVIIYSAPGLQGVSRRVLSAAPVARPSTGAQQASPVATGPSGAQGPSGRSRTVGSIRTVRATRSERRFGRFRTIGLRWSNWADRSNRRYRCHPRCNRGDRRDRPSFYLAREHYGYSNRSARPRPAGQPGRAARAAAS